MAGILALTVVALVLFMNLVVTEKWWRLLITVSACAIIVAITLLIPPTWRVRLGSVAGIFMAAAGVLPIFLIDPEGEKEGPKADPLVLATYIEKGPFDQRLPEPLVMDGLTPANAGTEAGAKKLTAVRLKIKVKPEQAPLIPGDNGTEQFAIWAHIEVYPTAKDAAARGSAHIKRLNRYDTPTQTKAGIGNFCFQGVNAAAYWDCGGVRGNSYAEVTLSPGDNAHLGMARDTVTALLNYSDSMARKATPQKQE
ncbi:hypothetical protein [Streptomyces tubercidicus]